MEEGNCANENTNERKLKLALDFGLEHFRCQLACLNALDTKGIAFLGGSLTAITLVAGKLPSTSTCLGITLLLVAAALVLVSVALCVLSLLTRKYEGLPSPTSAIRNLEDSYEATMLAFVEDVEKVVLANNKTICQRSKLIRYAMGAAVLGIVIALVATSADALSSRKYIFNKESYMNTVCIDKPLGPDVPEPTPPALPPNEPVVPPPVQPPERIPFERGVPPPEESADTTREK